MLSADNTNFINTVVDCIRWACYLAMALGFAWLAFWTLVIAVQAAKWLWHEFIVAVLWRQICWPVIESVAYPIIGPTKAVLRWMERRDKAKAIQRMRELGY